MRSVHLLGAECCRRVPDQGYVIAEFGAAAGGRLDAGIGYHSRHNDLFDAALLELKVEVGIGKPVLAPMLLDHDIAGLGHQIGMPVAAPHALSEDGFAIGEGLAGARMTPSVIIALAPASVRDIEHSNADAARGLDQCAQMR